MQSDKDTKQATLLDTVDSDAAGKVLNFSNAQDERMKDKSSEKLQPKINVSRLYF